MSKAVVVWNADAAALSAMRAASEHAGGATTALVKTEPASPLASTVQAAQSRLEDAQTALEDVVSGNFTSGDFWTRGPAKAPFNLGITSATTAVKMLQVHFPQDVALRDAARGLAKIGTASTGTWGATVDRAGRAIAHVDGVLHDITAGRFG